MRDSVLTIKCMQYESVFKEKHIPLPIGRGNSMWLHCAARKFPPARSNEGGRSTFHSLYVPIEAKSDRKLPCINYDK